MLSPFHDERAVGDDFAGMLCDWQSAVLVALHDEFLNAIDRSAKVGGDLVIAAKNLRAEHPGVGQGDFALIEISEVPRSVL